MSGWTDARVALLEKLCLEKLSSAQIAVAINKATGSQFSRNAVIGATQRRKIARPFLKSRAAPGARQAKPKTNRNNFLGANMRRRFVERIEPELSLEEALVPADFLGLTFNELDDSFIPKLCRYPHGDGANILYCGQPVKEGSSYCPSCHRLCYHRLQPQSRSGYFQFRGVVA